MRRSPQIPALSVALFLGSYTALVAQEVPRVVTDILPIHSLVSKVMEGAGAPDFLLGSGTDPHNHALRPSQAAQLERAEIIVAIGPALTPWLEKPLTALASGSTQLILLEVEGTSLHEYRGEHNHDHGSSGEDTHDDHDDHADHEEHEESHGPLKNVDPHAWLDPSNARVWLTAIADALANQDPERADLYRKNADAARAALGELETEWKTSLSDVGRFAVHHDAFQYFESPLGLAPAFVIKEDDAHQPGAARIAALRAEIAQDPVACIFIEPLVNRGLVETVAEGTDAKVLELDPIGVNHQPGPNLFSLVLRDMAAAFANCR